ncbi:MAG: PTS sugar transporter subunit IIB [Desulfuromonas sp.]|nr:PTS sugar transporter subunit IIB [Desulfuromonas sp.]
MAIVLARVDNRLIHGQVLEAWVPYVRATSIVVVDDIVAQDAFRRQLMQAVVPSTIAVQICSHEQIPELCKSLDSAKENVLVLFANPNSALQAYLRGLVFKALNLGNMHIGEHKCCISKTLYMDTHDLQALEQLAQCGVDISAQCIPTDKVLHWDCNCRSLR